MKNTRRQFSRALNCPGLPRVNLNPSWFRVMARVATLCMALARAEQREVFATNRWNDATFFDSFQTGESTWDYDAAQIQRAAENPFHNYVDGYNPDIVDPFDPKEVSAEWFASLPSGGSEQAFQTLPEPQNGPYGHAQKTGIWYHNDGGQFIDAYDYPEKYAEQAALQKATGGDVLHLLKGAAKKQANWFDASVSQYDAYGRPKAPYPGNPVVLQYAGYQQQAVNSTLSCSSGGCKASAQLSFSKESDLQNCKLSVLVKPTDFGEDKVVEFIKLNDQVISINCQPPKVDCSEASNKLSDLFSCVEDMDVQLMFKRNNSLELIAKISDAVNKSDCAYKGKMLYAVPQVTCMVGNLTERVKSANSTGYERPSAQPMDLPMMEETEAKRGLRSRVKRGAQSSSRSLGHELP